MLRTLCVIRADTQRGREAAGVRETEVVRGGIREMEQEGRGGKKLEKGKASESE